MKMFKVLTLVCILLICNACSKEPISIEPDLVFFESIGSLDGSLIGNVDNKTWQDYTNSPNTSRISVEKFFFDEFSPKPGCDTLSFIYISSLEQGYYKMLDFYIYFDDALLQSTDTLHKVYPFDLFNREGYDEENFCNQFPKVNGWLVNRDAPFGDYNLIDTVSNFIKLDYISKDTIKGSFNFSFIFFKSDEWLQNFSFIDKYLTFECREFVAVWDD